MIITSHIQKNIQIYTCLLKLSRKQESVMDGQTDGRTDGQTVHVRHILNLDEDDHALSY